MKRTFLFFLFLAAVSAFLPALGGVVVQHQIQNRIPLHAGGIFIPHPFAPAYYLRNAHFVWKDRVELVSGNLEVRYDPRSLAGKLLRVRLLSRNSKVRLLGEWAEIEGVRDADISYFDAELGIGRGGVEEIYSVEVDSTAFQFRVEKSET